MKNRTVRRTNRRRQRKSRYTYEGGAEMGEKPEIMGGSWKDGTYASLEDARAAAAANATSTNYNKGELAWKKDEATGTYSYVVPPTMGGRYRRKSRRNRRRSNRRH